MLVACDVYRPAAIDQLKQLGKQLNIEVYEEGKKDPIEISNNAINYAKENNYDYVLIDIGLKHKFNEEHSKDGTSITLKSCYYYLLDLDLGLTSLTYTSSRVQGRKKQVRGIRMSIEDFTRVLINKSEI